MNSMFDVDCPRTPDGGDGDDKQKGDSSSSNNKSSTKSRSSRAPSYRPPRSRSTSATARTTSRSSSTSRSSHHYGTPRSSHARSKQLFSPRIRGSSRKSSAVPLEPEEYIAEPTPLPPRAPTSTAPSSGSGPVAAAPSSGGQGTGGLQKAPSSGPSAYRAAPNSGNGGQDGTMANRNRAHSTEAFGGPSSSGASTNPFDAEAAGGGGNRRRSSSGNWWREEIVDEGADKGAAMDKYYGLNQQEKQDLYGPPPPTTGPSGNGQFDVEQQPPTNGTNTNGNALNTNIYQQAASMNNAGYYSSANANTNTTGVKSPVDDYSFSNVHLTPGGNALPAGVASPGNLPPGTNVNDSGRSRTFQLPKWFGALATNNALNNNQQGGYLPPNMDHQTNIAPRGGGSSSSEAWAANSPRVTFDCFYPNGVNKKQGFWGSLSPEKKVGISVIWVVLVCTIFGVTISELKKANQVPEGGGYGSEVQGMNPGLFVADDPTGSPTSWPETPEPTLKPTTSPTKEPTPAPTKKPVTDSPIKGFYLIHGKESNGTPRPTRSPITSKPTMPPTPNPTNAPSKAPVTDPPTVQVQSVQAAPNCNDEAGFFINHLDNPKDCNWLGNGKPGYTDRKDKNCGGRPVQDEFGFTTTYPTTPLGHMCRMTCGLYNGCGTDNAASKNIDNIMMPFASGGSGIQPNSSSSCRDGTGYFLNQWDNPKTCEWLFNDKPGQTDRKDKNCGFGSYAITELGRNCMATCAEYGNNGCASSGINLSSGRGQITMRGSALSSSSSCQDSNGVFDNHLGNPKDCEWLYNDKEGKTDRKDKNCGPDDDDMTDLGRACIKTCSIYTGACGQSIEKASSSSKNVKRGGDFLRPTPTKSSSKDTKKTDKKANTANQQLSSSQDNKGLFLNHKNSLKDCEWLYNDKPGKTDRKDKECGSEEYPITTELGAACPETCSPYKEDGNSGSGTKNVLGELTLANGSVMRSFSSPNYSYSLTSSSSSVGDDEGSSNGDSNSSNKRTRSTSCINGEGTYLDHKHTHKSCDWLMGVGHQNEHAVANHRQQKNCGSEEHGITELGLECPWSCKEYNDCDKARK